MKIPFTKLTWNGRTLDHNNIRYFDYSASGFSFTMTGKKAVATIISDADKWEEIWRGVLGVILTRPTKNSTTDNALTTDFKKIRLDQNENKIILFESEKEETVEIKVIRLSEAIYGYSGLKQLEVEGEILPEKIDNTTKPKIEVIGDSITCGYGIEGVFGKDVFTTMQERPDQAYAYLTMQNLNANFQLISRSGIGLISCYADPETYQVPNLTEPLMSQLWPYTDRFLSERLGLEPEVWDVSKFEPDLIILHLGTNDQSWVRGQEDRRQTFINLYEQMLESIHRRSPNAKILGCLGAMGQDLCTAAQEAITRFSKTFPAVPVKFVTFPMQDEQNDGIGTDWHPSAKTHKKMADQLTQSIKEFL